MKKLICLLLCLMMIIPAAISMADNLIENVSVTFILPEAGTTTGQTPNLSVSTNAPYTLNKSGCFWITRDGDPITDSSVIFEKGKTYYLFIDLYAKEGYEFASNLNISVTNIQQVSDPLLVNPAVSIVVSFIIPTNESPAPLAESDTTLSEKITFSKLKSVKLTAVSAKKLKIAWKKLSSKDKKKIKQIQIQVSTDKMFTTIVKEKFLKSSKTSWTIPGLKKNTKYFVRIRAYTRDGNVISVSKWVVKNKKTKKK